MLGRSGDAADPDLRPSVSRPVLRRWPNVCTLGTIAPGERPRASNSTIGTSSPISPASRICPDVPLRISAEVVQCQNDGDSTGFALIGGRCRYSCPSVANRRQPEVGACTSPAQRQHRARAPVPSPASAGDGIVPPAEAGHRCAPESAAAILRTAAAIRVPPFSASGGRGNSPGLPTSDPQPTRKGDAFSHPPGIRISLRTINVCHPGRNGHSPGAADAEFGDPGRLHPDTVKRVSTAAWSDVHSFPAWCGTGRGSPTTTSRDSRTLSPLPPGRRSRSGPAARPARSTPRGTGRPATR